MKIWLLIKYKIFQIFGYCPHHGWFHYSKKYRRNTAYVEDLKNWGYGCDLCIEQDNEEMKELWEWYWSTRL